MSILDIKKLNKKLLFLSIFCFIFGLVYEYFSHEVYSNYMIYAFLIPLVFGFLFTYIIILFNLKIFFHKPFFNLYLSSIITFTIGSYIKGVLDIYGTTNKLIYVYPVIAVILLILAIFSLIKIND